MGMVEHVGTRTIETERLVLRKYRMDDADRMFVNWAADPEVTKFLRWFPHEDISFTKKIVGKFVLGYERADYYNWVITLKESAEPIGNVDVHDLDDVNMKGTLGFIIGRDFWGKGFASEAARAVIKLLISDVGLNRVQAVCDVLNIASDRALRKAGMKYEGLLRSYQVDKSGRIQDMCLYSFIKSDASG